MIINILDKGNFKYVFRVPGSKFQVSASSVCGDCICTILFFTCGLADLRTRKLDDLQSRQNVGINSTLFIQFAMLLNKQSH